MISATRVGYQVFPLQSLLSRYPVDFDTLLHRNMPTLLLSQLPSLNREHVEQLERVGIYDSDDFHQAGPAVMEQLHLEEYQYEMMQDIIHQEQEKRLQIPRLILDLPSNYILLNAYSTAEINYLGLYWRGLRIGISRPSSDYWNPIKHQFDSLMKKMKHPEIIGQIVLKDIPHWLEDVVPLSTYISHIPLEQPLLDMALSWGMPSQVIDEYESLDQQLLAQHYLLHLGSYLQ